MPIMEIKNYNHFFSLYPPMCTMFASVHKIEKERKKTHEEDERNMTFGSIYSHKM